MTDASLSFFNDTRGQHIYLTAVLFSILLLGMVTIGNSAVTTTAEIADGPERSVADLEEELSIAELNAARSLRSVNTAPGIFSASDRRAAAKETIVQAISSSSSGGQIRQTHLNASVLSVQDGVRVVQNADGNFTDSSSASNWDAVSGASDVRVGSIAFLETGTASQDLVVTDSPGSTQVFEIAITGVVNGSPVTRTIEVYETTAGELTVRYDVDGSYQTCGVPTGDTVRFSALHGYLGDRTCLDYPDFTSVSDIAFSNADLASGRYSIIGTADSTVGGSTESATKPPDHDSVSEPHDHHVVYAVTVSMHVERPNGEISRIMRLAPGTTAPDGGF